MAMNTAKKNKKSKKGLIGGIIAILVLGVLVLPAVMPKPTAYSEVTAETGNIETYYTFSGNVESKQTQTVLANNIIQIDAIKVSEGDQVKKDDVLFTTANDQEIVAGISGTIYEIYVSEDEQVMSGGKLCSIYDFEQLQITVKVDEHDLQSMETGKEVSVSIDALDQELTGTVSKISDVATSQQGVSYFTAVIDLPADTDCKVGMTAEVRVLNKQATNVLLVPLKAIQFDDEEQPYVLLKQEKGAPLKSNLEVGINDGKMVEVVSGLTGGETILYTAPGNQTTDNGGMMPPMAGR